MSFWLEDTLDRHGVWYLRFTLRELQSHYRQITFATVAPRRWTGILLDYAIGLVLESLVDQTFDDIDGWPNAAAAHFSAGFELHGFRENAGQEFIDRIWDVITHRSLDVS